MHLTFAIIFLVYFFIALFTSVILLYNDISVFLYHQTRDDPRIRSHFAIVFSSICQVVLSATAIILLFVRQSNPIWLTTIIFVYLHLLVCSQV
jgi:hypothetical protein